MIRSHAQPDVVRASWMPSTRNSDAAKTTSRSSRLTFTSFYDYNKYITIASTVTVIAGWPENVEPPLIPSQVSHVSAYLHLRPQAWG